MGRVSITDIVRETGLSRATVDRVLHNRPKVHPRTKAEVERAMARMSAALSSQPEATPVDLALRLDRGMMDEMLVAAKRFGDRELRIQDLHQMDDAAVLAAVRSLCQDVARPLALTVKNTPQIVMELAKARRRGKRVIALISDLAVEARDAFVGIDNRAAGETAAFLVGRTLGDRPTTVGFVLGDHAYRCHEDREIGFRSALRTHFPKAVLAAEAIGQDNAPTTYAAARKMLHAHPGIGAIYSVAGGHIGLVRAIQEANRTRDIIVVAHEANDLTVPLLRNGQLDFLISQDPAALLAAALQQCDASPIEYAKSLNLVDFYVHTAFNVPAYAR
jgi:LacI family transcriptional regulator